MTMSHRIVVSTDHLSLAVAVPLVPLVSLVADHLALAVAGVPGIRPNHLNIDVPLGEISNYGWD